MDKMEKQTQIQKKSEKSLQNYGEVCEEISRLGKTSERLLNLPINTIIRERGNNAVASLIMVSVLKCAEALQINLTDTQVETLAEDLIDVYKWDAIEDITLALKRGRQGEFGANYKQLNMILVRDWMRVVLYEKSLLREKAKHNEKTEEKQAPAHFDKQMYYQKYLEVERAKKIEEQKPTMSKMQFEAQKFEYFKNKKD